MTKEAAERMMFGILNYQWKINPFLASHVETVLSIIFDDFESRTCENCKHFDDVEKHKHYGYCTRTCTPSEVEHNWFCAGIERKEQK